MVSIRDRHLDAHTRARWTKPGGRELALVPLDGIAASAPCNYSALDPKSMEERGIGQSRRKPKFPYVSFHGRTKYAHVNQSYENPMRLATYQAKI